MEAQRTLVLERKEQADKTGLAGDGVAVLAVTPLVEESYWSYRVVLREGQAVVGFPKFFTIGIGFAVEEDWNTNLPYSCDARQILDHIWHNRGDETILRSEVLAAIHMIQEAVIADRAEPGGQAGE